MADYGSFHQFVSRFVGPLVTGGRVEVEGLIGPGVLSAWLRPADLDASLVAKVTDEARRRLARVGPVGHADQLPVDVLALAAAWHNLLAMTHPEARGRVALRRKARQWSAELLEWAGAPYTRAEVALRHGVLGRLQSLGRVDTHVTFWAGYADFVGVAPPPALVAWPKLRRVREDKTRVGLMDLLASLDDHEIDDEAADLVGVARAAFALSPLTDLCLADRPQPFAFAWTPPALNALADDALRGAAERLLLARGPAALRAVEHATLSLARTEPPPGVAALLLRTHLELCLMDALSSRGGAAEQPRAQSTAAAAGAPGASQPLAWDAYARLGYARAAALLGVPAELLQRALPIDPNRPLPKDPPSAPLLARSGAVEVRT